MIKFFRHIRKDLMEQNKTGRYVKYAIGEIVLVVIGILIALQINTWNIERNNSKQEVQILKQLQEEFYANLEELNGKISMRKNMINASENIIQYFDNGIDSVPLDSLHLHQNQIMLTPTFNPSTGVTSELLNSGKLYLIKNEALKKLLTNWSGDVEKLIEIEIILLNLIERNLKPHNLEHFRFRKMRRPANIKKMQEIFMIGESKAPSSKGSLDRDEFEKFYNDTYIENSALVIGDYAYYGNRQSAGIKERINTILKIIEEELNIKQ